MFAFSHFKHEWTKSEYPCIVPLSEDYRVFVNGEEVDVYTCRISKYPFNRTWPGYQRHIEQTECVSYVNLVSDEELLIEVEPLKKSADGRIMLKTYSKGIVPTRVGDRLVFSIKENGGYVFEIGDYHGLLYIFNNKPVPCEDPESVTYYFGKGVHFPGRITLRSNESVYVDKDALVYGSVFAEDAENIRIYGNGILDDTAEERIVEPCYEPYTNGNLKFYDCRNIRIEGIGVMNSAIWCVNLFHCFDVEIDGINVFGQWRYNTDGIDIVNSQNITVRNSFIHSFDDTVTVKGIVRYAHESNRDMLFEHCVLWCDWGKTCEIGVETVAPEYTNIVFRDCDLLRAGNTACDVSNGGYAMISDIVFEDIRVELESFYTASVHQRREEQIYDKADETEIARIVLIRNKPYPLRGEESCVPLGDKRYAGIANVTVKDVFVYCDESIAALHGTKCVRVDVVNTIPTTEYRDINVSNIVFNGKKLLPSEMDVCTDGIAEGVLTVS